MHQSSSSENRTPNRRRETGEASGIMKVEMLNVQGHFIPHYVVPIRGDGGCLFGALSFLIFRTQQMARKVRTEVATYVVNNWHSFSILSHNAMGDNYLNEMNYWYDMSQPYTYGGLCELVAAGKIYPFSFEVYRDGQLFTQTGKPTFPVRRLKFSNDLSAGHFDAYEIKNSQLLSESDG
ncbi:uncharacterized protein [Drosophila tropicalis]|uniref:uncharacterized protein n=1 Tax=Drosophila tropicalis TaxID=46794 RepID=UPI0035AB6D9D